MVTIMNKGNLWYRNKLDELNEENKYCANPMCQSLADEWAHLEPTGVKGRGRGRNRRTLDILKHRSSYARLCKKCHDILDGDNNSI